MKIELSKEELNIILVLLQQGRFTLLETQRVMPLAQKISNSIQNYNGE